MVKYYNWIKTILQAIIEKKIPPTLTARFLFIFNSTVVIGVNSLIKIHIVENYKYINIYPTNIQINQQFTNNLILFASINALQLLNRDIKSKIIRNYINQTTIKLNENMEYQNFVKNNIKVLSMLSEDISHYYNLRNKDGWKQSNKQIHLDNPYYINVKTPINTKLMPNPNEWCPLKGQLMLGAKWGKVIGLIETNNIDDFLEKEYLKIDIKSQAKQVLETSLTLTPEQKATAEFWAGIGGSVTPPGFFNMFLYGYFKNNPTDNLIQVEYFYKLNCGLFQASIICWKTKYEYLQCRPIQSIRINYPDIPIDYYFGKTTTDLWTPYQESRLYTPPFPDYISGHSTFSSCASTILTNLLGKDLHKLNIILTKDDFIMLSPIFMNMKKENMNITEIEIPKDSSKIIKNTPLKSITLRFNSWREMAKSAGISRIYGGIHYPTSNLIALKVGKCIGKKILNQYKKN